MEASDLLEVARALLKNSVLFFVVRGEGEGSTFEEALQKAKRPLNVPARFRYERDYKPMEIASESIFLLEIEWGRGIAVPAINNGFICMDVEGPLIQSLDADSLFPRDEVYQERTPRGGRHIVFRADCECDFKGVKGLLDVKYRGMFTIAPSTLLLKVRDEMYYLKYEKLSEVELWETAPLSKYRGEVEELVQAVGGFRSCSIKSIPEKVDIKAHPLSEVVRELSVEELLTYAQLVFESIGCGECTRQIIVCLINREPIFMPNVTYPISVERGLHTVFEVELLGALRLLGASHEQLLEVVNRISYKDYAPQTPPINNLIYNVLRGRFSLALKGLCPFMVANGLTGGYVPQGGCSTSLVYKLSGKLALDPQLPIKCLEALA